MVQVTKEGVKTKGPTLSTYLALAGKHLVMMPWMRGYGISHKIEDEEERKRLAQVFDENKPPKGHGFIIRTAGEGASKRDIQNDLRYLNRLWSAIEKRMETEKAPGDIYQESDLVIRALRDTFAGDIERIICDSDLTVRKIRDFLSIATPRLKPKVVYYDGKIPLFHKYQIEDEITKVQSRTVELKSGGSIVIEQTEAMVSIDVNSGRYRKQKNAEQTAYESNMEAATEIARQLRLRDLGGLIVCDFIDMRSQKHRKEVETAFRDYGQGGPCPHEDPADQPLRRRRDDPPADAPVAAIEHVPGLPPVRRHRVRQEPRVAGPGDHPPAEPGGVQGPHPSHRAVGLARGGRLPPEREEDGDRPDRADGGKTRDHSCLHGLLPARNASSSASTTRGGEVKL